MQQNYINDTLNFIHKNGYNLTAEKFLNKTAKFLSELLEIDYVLISQYALKDPSCLKTLAFYHENNLKPNITYNGERIL